MDNETIKKYEAEINEAQIAALPDDDEDLWKNQIAQLEKDT